MTKRDPGLDLLRCIAIVLVMFRHYQVIPSLTLGGWIGVDLFFVLSGFLVSGLLFKEYQGRGRVNAARFLIRRGFKIYPTFWFVLALQLWYLSYKGADYTAPQLVAELLFVQNFFPGIMGISWTLAIEEHFYLLVALLAVLAVKNAVIARKRVVVGFCLGLMAACLVLRVYCWSAVQPFNPWIHFFPTYLRLDALSFGVLISWFAHFSTESYRNFIKKYAAAILVLSLAFVAWPFLLPFTDALPYTVGLTVLYLGFGGIVSLVSVFRLPGVRFWMPLAYIGRYSYSIYLVHLVAGPAVANYVRVHLAPGAGAPVYVLAYFAGNILVGVAVSLVVEQFFLRIRELYFKRSY